MFSLFLSVLIVKAHRLISLGILYMSNSAFEIYCIFNYRESSHDSRDFFKFILSALEQMRNTGQCWSGNKLGREVLSM